MVSDQEKSGRTPDDPAFPEAAGRICECGADEACRFARERDDARSEADRFRSLVGELAEALEDLVERTIKLPPIPGVGGDYVGLGGQVDALRRYREETGRSVDQQEDAYAGAVRPGERTQAYYGGVADAMDVIRAHDFPDTTRVDLLAEKLAPRYREETQGTGSSPSFVRGLEALRGRKEEKGS